MKVILVDYKNKRGDTLVIEKKNIFLNFFNYLKLKRTKKRQKLAKNKMKMKCLST